VTSYGIFQGIYGSPEARGLRAMHKAPVISQANIFAIAYKALNGKS